MRLRIVQCVCGPQRHCLVALAVLDPERPDDEVGQMVHAAVKEALAGRGAAVGLPHMNPWCGICGAPTRTWKYEIAWSKAFADEAAALAALQANEDDQRTTAALLDLLDLSHDARQRRKH